MKLLQTIYNKNFVQTITKWNLLSDSALFHVFVPYNLQDKKAKTDKVREAIRLVYPDIPVVGSTAIGEIFDGTLVDWDIVVSVMVFENPDTRIKVFPYYSQKNVADVVKLLDIAKNTENLKGIEIITAAPYQQLETAGEIIDQLPENIEVFGSVAVGDEMQKAFVFANECDYCMDSTICIFYIGSDFYIHSERMIGWKAIGYPLKVTRSKGAVVYELDGKPAYDVYNHYLRINKDNQFFYNALQFPWEVQVDENTTYLRHAKSVNPDGSIVMSSNIPEGADIRLTFGDPRRMMSHTKHTKAEILKFSPDIVYVINCFGRKLFWNDNDAEVAELSRDMETTGFSALGEILRYNGITYLNNLSIVCVAMREGSNTNIGKSDFKIDDVSDELNLPISHRLAVFINTITDELMEKNEQLNKMLYKASHDALTGLLNRGAIERIIYESLEDEGKAECANWHLIMLDIDNFKHLNDTYGHIEGDNALKALAKHLKKKENTLVNLQAGRWGGEEFMIYLQNYSDQDVLNIAEAIRIEIKDIQCKSGNISVSVGATKYHAGEGILATIERVDSLLYEAKNNGKDKVCSDL